MQGSYFSYIFIFDGLKHAETNKQQEWQSKKDQGNLILALSLCDLSTML